MNYRRSLLTAVFLSSIICLGLLLWTLQRPIGLFTQGDAEGYHSGAVSLLTVGQYQFRGLPYTEREPGQSIFLAGIYAVFGIGNFGAVFLVHWIISALAIVCLAGEVRRAHGERAAIIAGGLLLLSAPIFHTIFTLNREALALALFQWLTCMLLRLHRTRRTADALIASALFGTLLTTYVPYMFLPAFLLPTLLWIGVRPRHVATLMIGPCVMLGLWGLWVQKHTGTFCVSTCHRSAVMWYVRGEQARELRGLEPLRCLWSEYVTRDWSGRSPSCAYAGIYHRDWPNGLYLDDRDIIAAQEGRREIRKHFLNHLWFSVFSGIELHLPYVNGWGRWYNIAAVLWTAIVYFGIPWGIGRWRKPSALLWICWALIAYATSFFSVTYALPRFLLPVMFAYAVLAGIGYDRLLSHLRPRHHTTSASSEPKR